MSQRIIVAYNPRSSKHARIREEVIEPVQKLPGYIIGKYEIKSAPVDENVEALAKILSDGDFLIAAGGDGSATVAVNAAMRSEADVTLGVLGYGNFNDFARMIKSRNLEQIIRDFENGKVKELYPLEAKVDGKLWRYAACYFTMGMFAESTKIFDMPKTRNILRKGKKSLVFSVVELAKWYFKNKKNEFLDSSIRVDGIALNRKKVNRFGRMKDVKSKHVSDILFVNGSSVARVMKGGDYWQSSREFFVGFGRLKGLFRLGRFMMKSMLGKMPGRVTKKEITIEFAEKTEFEIQAEGECIRMKASKLVIGKATRGVKVVIS